MTIDQILHRLFRTLAEEHQYAMSEDEIGLYIAKLAPHGLNRVKEAVLSLIATTGLESNVFPSVVEFEKVIARLARITER